MRTAESSGMHPVNRAAMAALLILVLSGCTQLSNKDAGAVTYDASSGAGNAALLSGVLHWLPSVVLFTESG
jgi:hypothetical protein